MSIPALLNEMVDRIFFYLHYTLNDELVIQAFESFEIVIIGIASYLLLGAVTIFLSPHSQFFCHSLVLPHSRVYWGHVSGNRNCKQWEL